jgi:hypothetical protein
VGERVYPTRIQRRCVSIGESTCCHLQYSFAVKTALMNNPLGCQLHAPAARASTIRGNRSYVACSHIHIYASMPPSTARAHITASNSARHIHHYQCPMACILFNLIPNFSFAARSPSYLFDVARCTRCGLNAAGADPSPTDRQRCGMHLHYAA